MTIRKIHRSAEMVSLVTGNRLTSKFILLLLKSAEKATELSSAEKFFSNQTGQKYKKEHYI